MEGFAAGIASAFVTLAIATLLLGAAIVMWFLTDKDYIEKQENNYAGNKINN